MVAAAAGRSHRPKGSVSIPVRVLGWLQLVNHELLGCCWRVSIPVRVLGWLQLRVTIISRRSFAFCFNPCKGFGVVAAPKISSKPASALGFNPCKGFGVVAALTSTVRTQGEMLTGFNPCKGFGVVAAPYIVQNSERAPGFNPCKGFGVVAAKSSRRASCI